MTDTHSQPDRGGACHASAFHPTFAGRTARGTLTLSPDALQFESDLGTVALPLKELKVRLGGYNSETIFFEHASAPGWSIYTSDREILERLTALSDTEIAGPLKTIRRPSRWPLAAAAVVVISLLLGPILLFVLGKDWLARVVAERVPLQWEQTLGNQLFNQLKSRSRVVHDPKWEKQLEPVLTRLSPVLTKSGHTFQFHIVEDSEINAFALPGGHIVVHTALLKAVKRPEELAGVLAHEMAHVTQRHGFRKIIESTGAYLIVQTVFGDVSGLLAAIANSSEFLLNQSYSRSFEREADDAAWQYLVTAKIDPRGMIDFFRTLRTELDREGVGKLENQLSFLSTHPATQERINRLEKKWNALGPKFTIIELEKSQ